MANQITGSIQSIGPTLTIASKDNSRTFLRRELILDASRYDQYTGEKMENVISIEFGGNKCSLLDSYAPGQLVTISFTLSGRNYIKPDGTQGNFTRVQGYAIEERRVQAPQTPATATQPPQMVNPSPAPIQVAPVAQMTPSAAPQQQGVDVSPDGLPF